MKKFLSISFCLMLCLTSILFIGCEEKPTEAEIAKQQMTSAYTNMLAQDAFKIEGEIEGQEMTMIYSADVTYIEMTMMGLDMKIWSIDGYDYTETSMGEFVMYTKSVSEEDVFGDMTTMDENIIFISSTVEDGVTTLVFKEEYVEGEVEESYAVYTIENDLITSIVMQDAEHETIGTINIVYEDVVVPVLPTEDGEGNPIVWEDSSMVE